MNTRNIATQIDSFDNVIKIYYDEERIYVLFDDKSDILYCRPFPEIDGIKYVVVDDEEEVPSTSNKIN